MLTDDLVFFFKNIEEEQASGVTSFKTAAACIFESEKKECVLIKNDEMRKCSFMELIRHLTRCFSLTFSLSISIQLDIDLYLIQPMNAPLCIMHYTAACVPFLAFQLLAFWLPCLAVSTLFRFSCVEIGSSRKDILHFEHFAVFVIHVLFHLIHSFRFRI